MLLPFPKDDHLNKICRYITQKTGMGFDEMRRKQLGEIIQVRCDNLGYNHIRDYSSMLCSSSESDEEFDILMDILTIQESCFFRQEAQFHVLKRFCLPRLLERWKVKHKRINIWSAGCANGEEAYSIAMLFREICPENPKEVVYIKATDISRQALQKAKEGIYSKRAVRNLGPRFLDRYFTKQKNRYVLSEEIRSLVDFEYLNLAEEPFIKDGVPQWDIVFCRNVIIYFTNEQSRKLLKNFYMVMADGGYLFAGFSETLRYLNDDFIPIHVDNAFVYQKDISAVSKAAKTPPPAKTSGKSPTHGKTTNKPQGKPSSKRPNVGANIGKIPPDTGKSLDERLVLARKLADKGETLKAVELLDHIIQRDPLRTEAYFVLAMIYRNAGNLLQSSQYLKKVIYLQPENALARLHLADICRESARKADAAREYANVISLLENRKDLETDTFGEGLTGGAILKAARAHLKRVYSV